MASFTPLGLGTNGGMGVDCNWFLKRLAEKLSEENEETYHTTVTWIRTLLTFEILRSVRTCVRGSRTPSHKILQGDFIDDCYLNAISLFIAMIFFVFVYVSCFLFLLFLDTRYPKKRAFEKH